MKKNSNKQIAFIVSPHRVRWNLYLKIWTFFSRPNSKETFKQYSKCGRYCSIKENQSVCMQFMAKITKTKAKWSKERKFDWNSIHSLYLFCLFLCALCFVFVFYLALCASEWECVRSLTTWTLYAWCVRLCVGCFSQSEDSWAEWQ